MPGRPATTSAAVVAGEGITRASCGLLKFCYSAGLLARASHLVVNLEPIVLTDAPRRARSMCAGAQGTGGVTPRLLGWPRRLQRLLQRHSAAVSASTNDTAWLSRAGPRHHRAVQPAPTAFTAAVATATEHAAAAAAAVRARRRAVPIA